MNPKHMIVIITGPSAVGKTAIAKGLLKKLKNFKPGVTYTTRGKRKKYSEDKIMRYVSIARFKKLIREKKFLEWAEVYGNFYGTSRAALERKAKKYHLILNLDVKGARMVMRRVKNPLSFFIQPDSLSVLKQRLDARDMPARDKKLRLRQAKNEMAQAKNFDYQIVNRQGHLEKAVRQVLKIVNKYQKMARS